MIRTHEHNTPHQTVVVEDWGWITYVTQFVDGQITRRYEFEGKERHAPASNAYDALVNGKEVKNEVRSSSNVH